LVIALRSDQRLSRTHPTSSASNHLKNLASGLLHTDLPCLISLQLNLVSKSGSTLNVKTKDSWLLNKKNPGENSENDNEEKEKITVSALQCLCHSCLG
jgi:hypothetical protein